AEQDLEQAWIGLAESLLPRHHDAAKAAEKSETFERDWKFLLGPVGQRIKLCAPRIELREQRDAFLERTAQHFRPANVVSLDELGVLRKSPLQVRDRFCEGTPRVLLLVPGLR